MNDGLVAKVRSNLDLQNNLDDALIYIFIIAAVSYAESYQRLPEGIYYKQQMQIKIENAVIKLSSHFYKTKDGLTDTSTKESNIWNDVNELLCSDNDENV